MPNNRGTDKDNQVYIHSISLFKHKEQSYVICRKMDKLVVFILSKLSQFQKNKDHMFFSPSGFIDLKEVHKIMCVHMT